MLAVYTFRRKAPFPVHAQVSLLPQEVWPNSGTSAELRGCRYQHWKGPDTKVLELGV